jgi:hypothetical protein
MMSNDNRVLAIVTWTVTFETKIYEKERVDGEPQEVGMCKKVVVAVVCQQCLLAAKTAGHFPPTRRRSARRIEPARQL